MAKIRITDCIISGNGGGIGITEKSSLEVINSEISGNKTFGVYVHGHFGSIREKLGLPNDCPPEAIAALLKAVSEINNPTPADVEVVARKQGFLKYVPAVANFATIGSLIIDIAKLVLAKPS